MPSSLATVTAPRSWVKVIKQRIVGDEALPAEEDFLAIEDPLEIELRFANGESKRVVTMRTPGQDSELIHGFLHSEGLIRLAQDITEITFNEPTGLEPPTRAIVRLSESISSQSWGRSETVHTSCGVCGTESLNRLGLAQSLRLDDKIRIEAAWIHTLPAIMRQEQTTFRQTGGLHAAALFTDECELLVSREDIGRHNALDKVIGTALISQTLGRVCMLCVSGRMSYEILQKALVAQIPIIAGVGAPSSLAVALANDFNVTLVGFVRQGSFNIYSCPERLKL